MQVLKESIKLKITTIATKQFNKVGYINTSMKDIAKMANISVGNIYRYFSDKEYLFEYIVNPTIKKINELFDSLEKSKGIDTTKKAMNEFVNIYIENKEVFLLVLENSNNTKVASIKESIIEKFYKNAISFSVIKNKIEKEKDFSVFMKAFSSALINGTISILLENISDKKKSIQIEGFLTFMRNNIIRISKEG